jgi:hypothetical protein
MQVSPGGSSPGGAPSSPGRSSSSQHVAQASGSPQGRIGAYPGAGSPSAGALPGSPSMGSRGYSTPALSQYGSERPLPPPPGGAQNEMVRAGTMRGANGKNYTQLGR